MQSANLRRYPFLGNIAIYLAVSVICLSFIETAHAATFPANAGTLGAIPDSNLTTPACQNNSTTQKDVTFTVTGLTGVVGNVQVNFNASHTYIQDLEVTLIGPLAGGTSPTHLLFSATGTTSTTANACGSLGFVSLSSANTYTFSDTAAANWWTTASSVTSPNAVPTSTNRTVVTGIGGTTNPAATTNMNPVFSGIAPNGTWTLRFRDRGSGDTGSVTAANLTINTATAAGVNVSGRVFSSTDGRGLTGAVVRLTDQNGATRTMVTGRLGSFTFDDVEPGQTYVISVASRRFNFSPRVIQIVDNMSDLEIIPD